MRVLEGRRCLRGERALVEGPLGTPPDGLFISPNEGTPSCDGYSPGFLIAQWEEVEKPIKRQFNDRKSPGLGPGLSRSMGGPPPPGGA